MFFLFAVYLHVYVNSFGAEVNYDACPPPKWPKFCQVGR